MCAGLRGDFTGHRRFLVDEPGDASPSSSSPTTAPTCWSRMLDGLAAQTHPPDAVFVVDNASTDHTRDVLGRDDLPLRVTRSDGQPRRRRRLPPRRRHGVRRRASTGSG